MNIKTLFHRCHPVIVGRKTFDHYVHDQNRKFNAVLLMCPVCHAYSIADKDLKWSAPIPKKMIDMLFHGRPNYPDRLGWYLSDYWFKRDWDEIFREIVRSHPDIPWMGAEEQKAREAADKKWIKENIIDCGAPMHYEGGLSWTRT
jgi:hypothetical protein